MCSPGTRFTFLEGQSKHKVYRFLMKRIKKGQVKAKVSVRAIQTSFCFICDIIFSIFL